MNLMRDLKTKQILLCIASAFLLSIPFFLDLAWPLLFISFIPLFTNIENLSSKKAFKVPTAQTTFTGLPRVFMLTPPMFTTIP